MDKMKSLVKSAFKLVIITGVIVFLGESAMAEGAAVQGAAGGISEGGRALAYAAMGAVGVSCAASSYALSRIGAAAMGAMSEKPEVGGRALIFLGMAEGIAIYGLIIAIMLVNKI